MILVLCDDSEGMNLIKSTVHQTDDFDGTIDNVCNIGWSTYPQKLSGSPLPCSLLKQGREVR